MNLLSIDVNKILANLLQNDWQHVIMSVALPSNVEVRNGQFRNGGHYSASRVDTNQANAKRACVHLRFVQRRGKDARAVYSTTQQNWRDVNRTNHFQAPKIDALFLSVTHLLQRSFHAAMQQAVMHYLVAHYNMLGNGVRRVFPHMAMIRWVRVHQDIPVVCHLLRDKSYTHHDTQEEILFHKGQTIQGVYKGYRNSEQNFEVILAIPEHQYAFAFYASDFTATLDAKQCFRCEWYLPHSEFERHPLTVDKSPILAEVCSDCYRRIKNKVAEHDSYARRHGGVYTLKVSEWLEILKASEGYCYYCKKRVGYERLIMEHKTPLSWKGANAKENVVPACIGCNSSKSSRDIETWQRHSEAKMLLEQLQEHLSLSKFETTNLAIKTLARTIGLIDGEKKP